MKKQNHLTEEQIDELLSAESQSSAADLSTRNVGKLYQAHLSKCHLCREHFEARTLFLDGIQKELEQEPITADTALARSILNKSSRKPLLLSQGASLVRAKSEVFDGYAEVIEGRTSLAKRFVAYARVYPFRAGSGVTAIAAAIVLSMFALKPKIDSNPSFANISNNVLIVFNSLGEELWRKPAIGMPDGSTANGLFDPNESSGKPLMLVEDIDGDGNRELLASGRDVDSPSPVSFARDTLYCFESTGSLRWKASYAENIFADKFPYTRGAKWLINWFFTLLEQSSPRPRLFTVAECVAFHPAKLIEIDPKTGRMLQTYWHAGGIGMAFPAHVENDSTLDIVLTGVNNGFERSFVAVLDPVHLEGCGPSTPDYGIENVTPGKEKYYILAPRTEIGKRFSTSKYNIPAFSYDKELSKGNIQLGFSEFNGAKRKELEGSIIVSFAHQMRIVAVLGNDPFIKTYERLQREGIVSEPLSSAYWERVAHTARYWDGEKFVTEPTMNRNYVKGTDLP